jgi:cation:H+ antiporter
MTWSVILCFVGFAMLCLGADRLVKGAAGLAKSLGLTPVVIGLTVVAFGTSAPELFVSLVSSVKGKSMIAVGNVIGSNICNIALVLGLAALFHPIRAQRSVVRRDIPIMLGISLALLVLCLNSEIGRIEGAVLFGGIILYTLFNYFVALRDSEEGLDEAEVMADLGIEEVEYVLSRRRQIVFILAGIFGVVFGAQLVVDSAVVIMKTLGADEKFIGLTIVAFGTSLPELATSVVAAIRKEHDISIGNLVGSNVFNLLSVLGLAALVRPIPIPGGLFGSGLIFDYLVMLFTSFLPWLMMRKTNTLSRRHGAVLLTCYVGYLWWLVTKIG